MLQNIPTELGVAVASLQVVDAVDQVGVNGELEEVGLTDDAGGILGEVSALEVYRKFQQPDHLTVEKILAETLTGPLISSRG